MKEVINECQTCGGSGIKYCTPKAGNTIVTKGFNIPCPDCPPKPEPSEKLIKRIRTEPYDPKWQHTVIIRTEDRDELCNRIEQLTARIKELEAKDGKAIHGT